MAFGELGASGGFGGLGAQGGAGSVPLLAAPVLTWTSDTATATPTFSLDGSIVTGDVIEVEIQISGGSWSSLEQDKTHTLSSGEDASDLAPLSFDALSNATHDARGRYQHSGVWSNWSNVETKTISASASAGQAIGLLLTLTKAA